MGGWWRGLRKGLTLALLGMTLTSVSLPVWAVDPIPPGNLISIEGRQNPGLSLSKLFRGSVSNLQVTVGDSAEYSLFDPSGANQGTKTAVFNKVFLRNVDFSSAGFWTLKWTGNGTLRTRFEVVNYAGSLANIGSSQVVKTSPTEFDGLCVTFDCTSAQHLWIDPVRYNTTNLCHKIDEGNHGGSRHFDGQGGAVHVRIEFRMNYTLQPAPAGDLVTAIAQTAGQSDLDPPSDPVYSVPVHSAETAISEAISGTMSAYVYMRIRWAPTQSWTTDGVGIVTEWLPGHSCQEETKQTRGYVCNPGSGCP